MTVEETNGIIAEFQDYCGLTLEQELKDHYPVPITPHAFVNRTDTALRAEIAERSPTTDLNALADGQKKAYRAAMLEQLLYMLASGDFFLLNGYDETNNSLADLKEMRKRAYSPLAMKILRGAGLLYAGADRFLSGGYLDERRNWR